MAHLRVTSGFAFGETYALRPLPFVIGREGPLADFFQGDNKVSRRHAAIRCHDEQFFLEDLRSRNGTWLNGEKLRAHEAAALAEGDQLMLCGYKFAFFRDAEPSDEEADPTTRTQLVSDTKNATIEHELDSRHGALTSAAKDTASSPTERLAGLIRFIESCAQQTSQGDALEGILSALMRIFPRAQRALIGAVDSEGRFSVVRLNDRSGDEDQVVPISEELIHHVQRSHRAVLMRDSPSRADRSILCAPLIDASDRVLGVIYLETEESPSKFQAADLELLTTIAPLAALSYQQDQLRQDRAEKQQLEEELKHAQHVQSFLLPASTPEFTGYEFFYYYRPASFVGGDYFDFITLPGGRLAVVVADVSGHRADSAILMANLAGQLRYLISRDSLSAAVDQLNRLICQQYPQEYFVTLLLMLLNEDSGQLRYIDAGHMPPLQRSADGKIRTLPKEQSGLPLGISEQERYVEQQLILEAGEGIILYTDGVTDTQNKRGKRLAVEGIRRFAATNNRRGQPPQAVGEGILSEIDRFCGGRPHLDDLCLVCVSRVESP